MNTREKQPTADQAASFTRRPVFSVKGPVNLSLSHKMDNSVWSESQPNPMLQMLQRDSYLRLGAPPNNTA